MNEIHFTSTHHFFNYNTFSQVGSTAKKSYTTTRIIGEAPHIDGLIDDKAWDLVEWGGGDFTQRQPDDGAAPSVQTKFKILYDEKNLYVAFSMS